jgi:adenylate cyclase
VLRPAPAIAVAAAGLLLGLALASTDPAQRLDWTLYDEFMRIATREAPPAPGIVVVAIDEPSFTAIDVQWPWPRRVHGTLIDQLRRGGARVIVVDLLFDTPAPDPEDDRLLAAAIREAGNVVLASDLAEVTDRAYSVVQWSDPTPDLASAASALGVVRIPYDPDGVLRRSAAIVAGRPSLSAAAAGPAFWRRDASGDARLIRFNGPSRRGVRTVSYYQALDAEHLLPHDLFRGAVVIVGRSLAAPPVDQEVSDHFVTPVALRMAGAEVHANALDTLIRTGSIHEPFAARWRWMLLCIGFSAAGALVFHRVGPVAGAAIAAVSMGSLAVVGYLLLAGGNTRLPIVGPAIALASVYGIGASYRFALGNRERRMIKRAFEHYVAPAIVAQMIADPSKLRLGGEEYEITTVFTDLEGFTTLSERLTPAALQRHLSGFFKAMMDVLLAEGATLDKFIGDAIMVYFGCPIPNSAHARQACRAALRMQARMRELNTQWAAEGLPALRMRVGINTGIAVAGNMGTDTIFNFTVLGDCVNLASRLEGVNKEYGTLVLAGEETWARVAPHFEGREIDFIRVKGKERPVSIYELAAVSGELPPHIREVFDRFTAGLQCYRAQQWLDAKAWFDSALSLEPADGPSATFARRAAEYARHPPAAGWDGVHVMHAK